MATSRPFAYNTGSTITGTVQVGNLAVGVPEIGFEATGLEWWNGADEDLGYVIAYEVPDDSQPTPISGVTASVQFWRSVDKTEASFISIAEYVTGQSFSGGNDASTYLTTNGYWNSWVIVPTPTPTNTPTITPTNTPTPTPTPSPQAASVTYNVVATLFNSADTYNFDLPSSYGPGFIVIAISSLASSAGNVSSVSIGGVSATQLTFVSGGTGNAISSIWGATITGSTDLFDITFSNTRNNCNIGIWTVQNLLSTIPTHSFTTSSSTSTVSGTLTGLTTNDIIISNVTSDRQCTMAWTNNTENYDIFVTWGKSGASRQAPSGSLTITATLSNTPTDKAVGSSIALR